MPESDSTPTVKTNDQTVRPRSRHRRLVWLGAIGVLLIGAVLGYRFFWLGRPLGSGPAGPAVSREAFAKVWSDRKVVLLGFGDSVTAGYGATPGHSFFDRLVRNPPDEFPDMTDRNLSIVLPNLEAKNLALSGSTSLEHIDVLLPKIPAYDDETFGIVVLTTGGNDIIHNYGRTPPREGAMYGATLDQAQPWIANFEERLETMLNRIGKRFPGGCHFFLANIYDPTDEDGDTLNAGLPRWPEGLRVHQAYNDVIERCAKRRDDVELIDMYREFLGHGIHCRQFWHRYYRSADPTYWYFDNLEDPHDRGYDAIRRLLLIEMSRVLPNRLAR
jgi:lysophospholipase L1-like esterase